MSKIELKHIDKYYGKNHILKDVNLTIEDGDFMTLLGPSGCGKTTTLRVVSGLEKPQNGTILMNGKEIVNAAEAHFAPPSERDLNLVFQSYALWPHMTVRENIAFGLNIQKLPKDEVDRRIEDALARMQIGQYVDRYPSELSGGQQQRVAIARAIASEPHLLLMDEPLSNLDAKLRVDMRSELKRLHIETGTTMIYVTHDQVEALTMSTKIAIFKEGVIVQVDHPLELYNNPVNLYVADFIGNPSINFADGKAEVGALLLEDRELLFAGGDVLGRHVGAPDLLVHVPDLEAEDGKAVDGHAEGFRIDVRRGRGREQRGEQGHEAGVHALYAVVALLVEPVDAVLAVGDDIGRHVAAAGRVLNVPELEIPQVLRADEGKERLGGGGGVGGDVVGLGFLAVPEGRGFVLGVETGIQKREQLRGCGHGYS